MEDIPWQYVVFVFIAFVSWAWKKIQETIAEQKRRKFQRVKRAYERQEKGLQIGSVQAPDAVREILQQMGVPVEPEEPQEHLRRPKAPPPLPPGRAAAVKNDTPLAVPVSLPKKKVSPPQKRPEIQKRASAHVGVRGLLRNRESLRNVLVASEILGPPKALRDES